MYSTFDKYKKMLSLHIGLYIALMLFLLITGCYLELLLMRDDEMACVASGEHIQYPIMWSQGNKNFHQVSEFKPDVSHFGINCKLEMWQPCNKNWLFGDWKLANSLDFKFGLIHDRRFENFETTLGINSAKIGEYLPIKQELTLRSTDFEIPISIRAKGNANVYLCDSKSLSNSYCYWFLIGDKDGTEVAVKKCGYGKTPSRFTKYEDNCETLKKVGSQQTFNNRFLDRQTWKHFVIKMSQGRSRTLSVHVPESKDPLLTVVDFGQHYNVNNAFVGLNSDGFYKVHKYHFIYTNKESIQKMGNLEKFNNENFFCIAMFLKMCLKCKFTVTLHSENGIVIGSQTVQIKSGEWEEHSFKFNITPFKSKRKYLQFVTDGKDKGVHWAVDEIRTCTNNDIRAIYDQHHYKVECESLKKNLNGNIDTLQLKLNSNEGTRISVTPCDRNTFKIGNFCYPCSFMSHNPLCNRGIICEYKNNTTNCACNFGYWGEKCDILCTGCKGDSCNRKTAICNFISKTEQISVIKAEARRPNQSREANVTDIVKIKMKISNVSLSKIANSVNGSFSTSPSGTFSYLTPFSDALPFSALHFITLFPTTRTPHILSASTHSSSKTTTSPSFRIVPSETFSTSITSTSTSTSTSTNTSTSTSFSSTPSLITPEITLHIPGRKELEENKKAKESEEYLPGVLIPNEVLIAFAIIFLILLLCLIMLPIIIIFMLRKRKKKPRDANEHHYEEIKDLPVYDEGGYMRPNIRIQPHYHDVINTPSNDHTRPSSSDRHYEAIRTSEISSNYRSN